MQGTQQLLLEITRRLVEGVSDTEIMKELNINDSELYYFYKKNIIETSKIVQSKKFQKSMAFELEMLKRHDVLFYVLYPELDPVIEKTPYAQRVDERRRVNTQGESKKALSLVTDDMVQDLAIVGSAKECRDKINKLYDYGITLPVVRVSVKPFKENECKDVFLRAIEALKN